MTYDTQAVKERLDELFQESGLLDEFKKAVEAQNALNEAIQKYVEETDNAA